MEEGGLLAAAMHVAAQELQPCNQGGPPCEQAGTIRPAAAAAPSPQAWQTWPCMPHTAAQDAVHRPRPWRLA